MTNAEKYLMKDIIPMELFKDFEKYCTRNFLNNNWESFERFMLEEEKPTLTDDERVILEFIKNFDCIGRDHKGLYYKLQDEDNKNKTVAIYNFTTNLFQFIKERRRIFY